MEESTYEELKRPYEYPIGSLRHGGNHESERRNAPWRYVWLILNCPAMLAWTEGMFYERANHSTPSKAEESKRLIRKGECHLSERRVDSALHVLKAWSGCMSSAARVRISHSPVSLVGKVSAWREVSFR